MLRPEIKDGNLLLHPTSFMEALSWALEFEAYSLKLALRRDSLSIPLEQIVYCRRLQIRGKVLYWLEIKKKYLNRLTTCQSLEGLGLSMEPIDRRSVFKALLWPELKDYFKHMHRCAVFATFIAFLLVGAMVCMSFSHWLQGHVIHDHWLVRGSCDLDCAKKLAHIHAVVLLLVFSILSPMLWAVGFYLFNRNSLKKYSQLMSLRVEASLLFLIGLILTGSALRAGLTQRYFDVVAKHRAGTLMLRQPASEKPYSP